ncbi:hypothetical protein HHI36_009719, partial [Cryptolaemus montrouzieri]
EFNVTITNRQPTRPVSGSCLDNNLVNFDGVSEVVERQISDNSAVKFVLQKDVLVSGLLEKILKRSINDRFLLAFLEKLSEVEWIGIYEMKSDENQVWECFFNWYKEFFDESFPRIRVTPFFALKPFIQSPQIKSLKHSLDYRSVISATRPEYRPAYNFVKKRYDVAISHSRKVQ